MSSGTSQGEIGVLANGILGGNLNNFSLPTSNAGLGHMFEIALVSNDQNQLSESDRLSQITAQQVQLQSFLNETFSRDLPAQNQMVSKTKRTQAQLWPLANCAKTACNRT